MEIPELIVFDFDGVLTDNRVYVSEEGIESVCCNRADGFAFDMLRDRQLSAIIMSTESNPVVGTRAKKLRVPVLQSITSKSDILRDYCEQHGVMLSRVMFVGNDLNDLEAMSIVGISVAPADAHPRVLKMATHVTRAEGGMGVAREIVERLFGWNYLEKPKENK